MIIVILLVPGMDSGDVDRPTLRVNLGNHILEIAITGKLTPRARVPFLLVVVMISSGTQTRYNYIMNFETLTIPH